MEIEIFLLYEIFPRDHQWRDDTGPTRPSLGGSNAHRTAAQRRASSAKSTFGESGLISYYLTVHRFEGTVAIRKHYVNLGLAFRQIWTFSLPCGLITSRLCVRFYDE